jgi:uncharacterized protein YfaS (alpha-2-macroglobulin family)
MKVNRSSKVLRQRVRARLKRLARYGPFVAGTLNRIEKSGKDGKVVISYLLTFKQKGKTRSVHVPKDMVAEVEQWVEQHRQLKKLMAEISQLSVGTIRRYVPEKRAAARVKAK